jgi:sialic acid synthase SpsE
MVRQLDAAGGSATPHPFSADEQNYRRFAKKTVVATRALAQGTKLGEQDLGCMRAVRIGLLPADLPGLVGRTLRRNLARFEIVGAEDVQ